MNFAELKMPKSRLSVLIALSVALILIFFFATRPNAVTHAERFEECFFAGDAACMLNFATIDETRNVPLDVTKLTSMLELFEWQKTVDQSSSSTCTTVLHEGTDLVRRCTFTLADGSQTKMQYVLRYPDEKYLVDSVVNMTVRYYFRCKYLEDPDTAGLLKLESYRQGYLDYSTDFHDIGIEKVSLPFLRAWVQLSDVNRFIDEELSSQRATLRSEK